MALARVKAIQALKAHQPQISSGCIFKNINGQSVGKIVDKQLRLKGVRIGEAQISHKHANFIENLGDAKANDIMKLIKLIKKSAKDKLNLDLKLEIQTIGF